MREITSIVLRVAGLSDAAFTLHVALAKRSNDLAPRQTFRNFTIDIKFNFLRSRD